MKKLNCVTLMTAIALLGTASGALALGIPAQAPQTAAALSNADYVYHNHHYKYHYKGHYYNHRSHGTDGYHYY